YPGAAPKRHVDVIFPAPEGWPIEAATCAGDGTTAVFGQGFARLYHGPGQYSDPPVSFDALLLGAAPLPSGGFIVATRAKSFPNTLPELRRFDASLEMSAVESSPDLIAASAKKLETDPRLMLFGQDSALGGGLMISACGERDGESVVGCT